MGESRCIGAIAIFLALILLSPSVYAHEQEILNVILVEEEARPGNVSDSAFVEGNGIVFRMRDNTENASMQIRIDLNQDGVFNGSEDNVSVWLTRSCSLDENGSLIDKNCAVSHQIIFGNTSQGVYDYQIERMIENLDTFISLDIPFLLSEREERLAFLKDTLDRADVSVAEKFSQVLQAYQVENTYGTTIEAYADTIELDGVKRQVDMLKWGRVALVFQTPFGS